LLLAARDAEGSRGLYFLHLATGETEPVLLPGDDDASELQDPRFSSDGRFIFYRRVGPAYEIVRWDRTADERRVLYSAPAGEVNTGFAVSPDGRWLAFSRALRPDGRPAELYVMPSAGGEPRPVFRAEPAEYADLQAFTADSAHLLFTRAPFGTSANQLWRVTLESGEAARIEIGLQPSLVRVHPDGRQLAVETRELYGEQWVIENLLVAVP
jgi:Tol biopolymer transport system component